MHRALTALLLLAPATAFKPQHQAKQVPAFKPPAKLASALAAGVISVATLNPFAAAAADSLVLNTPLEGKLSNFGAASYPVFNSITDASTLADRFVDFIDNKVKPADSADVVQKAVDGLLAIPDAKVNEYAGVLKQVVYRGVTKDTCVTLGGSEGFRAKLMSSSAVKSVPGAKMDALAKKFKPANSAVPVNKNGICLPGSVEASNWAQMHSCNPNLICCSRCPPEPNQG